MIYQCSICGYVYDEEKEGKPFSALTECPVCKQPPVRFTASAPEKSAPEKSASEKSASEESEPGMSAPGKTVSGQAESGKQSAFAGAGGLDLRYPEETGRRDSDYRYMKEIHEMAVTGKSAIDAMGTRMKMPGWDDVLVLGAQLNPMPLDEHAEVSLKTVIGKHAKKPMVLDMPVYISHMYFGALSKET